ncbi:hypothetical protein DJ72_12460 [Halorubrum distributum]|nr:hypothetical protein DJ72_12460 [Halorubrum distributum]
MLIFRILVEVLLNTSMFTRMFILARLRLKIGDTTHQQFLRMRGIIQKMLSFTEMMTVQNT